MAKKIRAKHWIISYVFLKEMKKALPNYFHGRLIDIGCGDKPYSSDVKDYVREHVGIDHEQTMHAKDNIDIFAPAYDIPVESASFDCALCTDVLEHLEEPGKAIAECARVLKPEGIAVYTVPFIYPPHEEPRDFYRYTKHGIHYLFENNGFQILELKPLSGFWITFAMALTYYLWEFRRKKRLRTILKPLLMLIPPFVLLMQSVAYVLDSVDKREEWTWMFFVAAKKKKKLPEE